MKTDDTTVNGVRISGATARDEQSTRAIDLPSGARAEVRKGYGRDLMRAQRAAAGGDASAVIFALIAEVTRVDGRKIVYEDVLEMDLADVMASNAAEGRIVSSTTSDYGEIRALSNHAKR